MVRTLDAKIAESYSNLSKINVKSSKANSVGKSIEFVKNEREKLKN